MAFPTITTPGRSLVGAYVITEASLSGSAIVSIPDSSGNGRAPMVPVTTGGAASAVYSATSRDGLPGVTLSATTAMHAADAAYAALGNGDASWSFVTGVKVTSPDDFKGVFGLEAVDSGGDDEYTIVETYFSKLWGCELYGPAYAYSNTSGTLSTDTAAHVCYGEYVPGGNLSIYSDGSATPDVVLAARGIGSGCATVDTAVWGPPQWFGSGGTYAPGAGAIYGGGLAIFDGPLNPTDQAEWVTWANDPDAYSAGSSGTVAIDGAAADGDTSGTITLAGRLVVAGAADGDVAGPIVLVGTLPVAGVFDGDVAGAITRSDSREIVGTADGDTVGGLALAGSLAVTGTADGDVAGNLSLVSDGTLAITGAADGDVSGSISLSASVPVAGAADGDLSGSVALAGALAVTGTQDGDQTGTISATAPGLLTITGTADGDAVALIILAGTLSITGTADGDTAGAISRTAGAPVTGTQDGDQSGQLALAGRLPIVGTADGDTVGALSALATAIVQITGTADGDAAGALLLAGTLFISGTADGDVAGPIEVGNIPPIFGTEDGDVVGTISLVPYVPLPVLERIGLRMKIRDGFGVRMNIKDGFGLRMKIR